MALGLVCVISVLSPQRIIVGGGVGTAPRLLDRVQSEVVTLLNGYLDADLLGEGIADYIVAPALGRRSGVLGAIALASTGVARP